MSSHFQSPYRNRRSYPDIPAQLDDDSTSRSLRGVRPTSMAPVQSESSHSQHSVPSNSHPSNYPQKYSPPQISAMQPQHVSSPNSQNFSAASYQPLTDQNVDLAQAPVPSQSQHNSPLNFPRPAVQRVPAPPLLSSDGFEGGDKWNMGNHLLTGFSQDAVTVASIGSGPGVGSQLSAQLNKISIVEHDRERLHENAENSADVGGGSGSAGPGPRKNGAGGNAPRSTQHQPKIETPPLAPSHTHPTATQPQRPLPVVPDRQPARRDSSSRSTDRDRASPTYFPQPPSASTEPSHQAHVHTRNESPSFKFDDHSHSSTVRSKTKTPDWSLPVQEENEGEEDVTITPELERERGRERHRDLELEKLERDQDKANERMDHRLPTPRFSSPMTSAEHMRGSEASSNDINLSTTIQGDEYSGDRGVYDDDEHDGRSSRTDHRFDDDRIVQVHHEDESHLPADTRTDLQDVEEQDDTESYTPKSHHASLPKVSSVDGVRKPERVVYNTAQLNFRPRTASSDGGRMGNLDTAVLHAAIEKLHAPPTHEQQGVFNSAERGNLGQQQSFNSHPSFVSHPHLHGQHTAYPTRSTTADEILALVGDPRAYEAWQANTIQHTRPGAPVPPTPPNATILPSLSYQAQSFSPAPPRSTPYPYQYHALHHSQDPQQLLQHMQHHQLQQLQLLAANGIQSDSTFSPSVSPFPTYDYSPFIADHFRRKSGVDDSSMSLRSSPSHMPVSLPTFTPRRNPAKRRSVRRMRGSRQLASNLPLRGESTEPRETSPSSSDGEEQAGGEEEFDSMGAQLEIGGSSESSTAHQAHSEDDGEWIDEVDDAEDDLLHLDYHPSFVINTEKRRRRWELKWDALVKAFQSLDRQTDTTLLLLAAPSHGKTLHLMRSRALRRIPSLDKASEIIQIKAAFLALSLRRKAFRAQARHVSLAQRVEQYGSSEGSEGREEELKGALEAALHSLSALSTIYESREQRWRTEMNRMGEERERVEVLLRQFFGTSFSSGDGVL